MTSNTSIGCSFPGCTNPVIGQCTGYKGDCGRFYCATHSSGTLCYEHAEQKRTDDIAQQIYDDYLKTAESIHKSAGDTPAAVVVSLITLALVFLGIGVSNGEFPTLSCLFGLGGLLVTWPIILNSRQKLAAQASITKPGFEEFYKEWSAQKDKEGLKKGLAVAGALTVIVLGVAGAASNAAQQQQVRDDIRSIRNKMD